MQDPKVAKYSVQNNRDLKAKESGPYNFKDKVSDVVFESLGILKDKELGLDQVDEEVKRIQNEAQIANVKLKGKGRRPDVQILEKEVVNGVQGRLRPKPCKLVLTRLMMVRKSFLPNDLLSKLLQL